MTHTPGPWAATDSLKVLSPDQNYVADCDVSLAIDVGEREPNARLIAAAPELLSIAHRWIAIDAGSWHSNRYAAETLELITATEAAIAKAEGRE